MFTSFRERNAKASGDDERGRDRTRGEAGGVHHAEGPRRFVLGLSTLLYLAVVVAGTIMMIRGHNELVDVVGDDIDNTDSLGFTLMFTVVAALALVTNVFAWVGTSRGERVSAAVTSVAFGLLSLFALWPFGLVVAPFPLLNAFFLTRNP